MPTLDFKGKQIVYAHHLGVPYRTLDVARKKSVLPKGGGKNEVVEEGNLVVHGDNLQALKALMPRYAGRVNCIYIDPPYNTGNEGWMYNDNVNSELMRRWLKDNGEVDREDPERHDKWLCMMWPRLQLLRELLAEDGAIFVSIDDNEAHRLRMVMDEIFGEENFRNEISVRRYDKNISRQFIDKGMKSLAVGYERVLAYAKSDEILFNPIYRPAKEERQKKGYWKGFWNAADRPTMRYNLLGVKPIKGQWKWKESEAIKAVKNYQEYQSNNNNVSLETYWRKTGKTKNFIRRREELTKGKNKGVEHWVAPSGGVLLSSNWEDILASENLDNIGIDFDSPKRVELIKRLVMMATKNNSVVLDSFAGSGTTAQAVLELNKEDGGDRKFILVECEDYADNITAERVRRVIKGVPGAREENLKAGLGGHFAFCTLGKELNIENLITGKSVPPYDALARHVAYIATGVTLEKIRSGKDCCFGETEEYRLHMIYRPDITFLRSPDSALTMPMAERIGAAAMQKGKTALVFAPWKFVSQKDLTKHKVTFCQLPYAIHRLFGD